MHRAVVLAVVLLFAVPTTAGADIGMANGPTATTTGPAPAAFAQMGMLTLQTETRSGFQTAAIDVGASLTIQRDAATAQLERYAMAASLGGLDDEERGAVLDAYMAEIEDRVETLREEERTLTAAYRDRSIDTRTYLIGLARIDARAAALRASLTTIDFEADRTQGFTYDRRIRAVENRLVEFDGPVRNRVLASVRGGAGPMRVYVESGQTGVVLSMIADDRHVREGYRFDKRTAGSETIDLDEVSGLLQENYPVAYNESNGWGIETSEGSYRLTFSFNDGRLIAHIDGGTEEVFYEVREFDIDGQASAQSATAADNGTRLVVNRSYPGGPLRVATFDNESGDPVASTVIVAGERLETGGDGVVWTLGPAEIQFDVTAVRPDGNVTTPVRPIEPVTVYRAD